MRKVIFLISLIFCLSTFVSGQSRNNSTRTIFFSSTDPVTCSDTGFNIYYNTSDNALRVCSGGIWTPVYFGSTRASTTGFLLMRGSVSLENSVIRQTGTILSINGAVAPTVVALTDAATITTDASVGNKFRVTLGGNRTLGNPTNATDGQTLEYEIIQDGTGSRTLTFDTKFSFGTDITACTLTTTASKRDFITVYYNSTTDKFYIRGCIKGY
jgi:hypothetical protein